LAVRQTGGTLCLIVKRQPTAHSSTFGFCRHTKPKRKTKRAWIFAKVRQI